MKWLRDLPGFGVASRIRINAFIRQWADAGVVTPQPGPEDGAPFPEAFWVELGHALFDDTCHRATDRSARESDDRRPGGPAGAVIPTPEP